MINTEHSIYDLDEIMNSNQDSKNKLTYYIGAIKNSSKKVMLHKFIILK